MKKEDSGKIYGEVKRKYLEKSIKKQIEALILDNIGKIMTREQILEVGRDPETGVEPENWHQRLSELRTGDGYTMFGPHPHIRAVCSGTDRTRFRALHQNSLRPLSPNPPPALPILPLLIVETRLR